MSEKNQTNKLIENEKINILVNNMDRNLNNNNQIVGASRLNIVYMGNKVYYSPNKYIKAMHKGKFTKKYVELIKSTLSLHNLKEMNKRGHIFDPTTYTIYNINHFSTDRRTRSYKDSQEIIRDNKNLIQQKARKQISKFVKRDIKFFKNIYRNIIDKEITRITTTNEEKEETKFNSRRIISKIGVANFLSLLRESVIRLPDDRNYNILIHISNSYYTFNRSSNMWELIDKITGNSEEPQTQSDEQIVYELDNNMFDIQLSYFKRSNKRRNIAENSFFKWYNKTHYDLTRYQIYTKGNNKYEDNCLVYALIQAGITKEELTRVRMSVKMNSLIGKHIKQVSDLLQIKFNVKRMDKNGSHSRTDVYGETYTREINIGIIAEHSFINEKTNITSYCIKHYKEMHNENNKCYKKDCNCYYDKHHKDNKHFIDSFDLIKLLHENRDDLLEEITINDQNILKTQFYNKVDDEINNLQYEHCTRKIKGARYDDDEESDENNFEEKKKEKIEYINVFADFEAHKDKNYKHKPHCVSWRVEGSKYKTIEWGKNCGYEMLKSLEQDSTLIFHNMKYDTSFLFKYIKGFNEVVKNNQIYLIEGYIYNYSNKKINIRIKDSYKLIACGLDKFNDMFKLGDTNKEIMPHDFFTEDNIDAIMSNKLYNINEIIPFLKCRTPFNTEKKVVQFIKNIKQLGMTEDKINMKKYCEFYCDRDVDVLQKGYNVFRKWILDEFEEDIDNILTISSLAHKVLIKNYCYDNIYLLSGIPQIFISKAIIGGRVMIRNNKKCRTRFDIDGYINDFDAVSLYPSAMLKLEGFLRGRPKFLKENCMNYGFLKKQDGYFVEIMVKSIGIKRDFPLLSIKNENGVREFTNDIIGKKFVVDKIALEDLIEFHKIKFDIIQGYYFNEGFNPTIKRFIRKIFDLRITKQNEKNPVEVLYKLIMNAAYGKSIISHSEYSYHYVENTTDMQIYLSKNYNYVNSIYKFINTEGYDPIHNVDTDNNDLCKYRIETIDAIKNHWNIPQVGASILSMSKRIMNRVMCTAEDNGIKIYYQDTDSMHIRDKDIQKLEEIYINKYKHLYENKDEFKLIGTDMGQFHSDFKLKDNNGKKCENVKAKESIFLGKKYYLDVLVGESIDNNNNVIECEGLHIRTKGHNEECLYYNNHGDKNGEVIYDNYGLMYENTGKENIIEIFDDLYNGESYEFDMTCDGDRLALKHDKNKDMYTIKEFKRTIKF